MFLLDARLRFQEVVQSLRTRADALSKEVHSAHDVLQDVARYARQRFREYYSGKSSDPMVVLLDTFIIEVSNDFIEAKKDTAMAIADEKRLAKQVELEHEQAKLWEEKAILAAKQQDDLLVQAALARKQEHLQLMGVYRQQWEKQCKLTETAKAKLRRMNTVIEHAKRSRNQVHTFRFARRAYEFDKQVVRMEQIIKGIDLLLELESPRDKL